jgi:hypothetical protein
MAIVDELVQETLYFDDAEEAERFRRTVEGPDVTVEELPPDADHFGPLILLAIAGAAAAVAGALAHWHEAKKGGQMIDLRKDAPKIAWRDPGVVYGLVVVVAEDGKVTVEVHEPKGYFLEIVNSVIGAVKDLGEKGIDAVKAGVDAAVGDKGSVSVEPVSAGV